MGVEEMISLIMEAFVDLLVSEDWLTEETKKFGLTERLAYTIYIFAETLQFTCRAAQYASEAENGYPDTLKRASRAQVDHEYRLFKVYDGGYYKTKFQFYEQYQRDVLERDGPASDENIWVAGAALVNAFYSPNTNEI
ncbi:hypothetical protein COOONC_06221, partial [Cooperia oncophora]